MANVDNIAVTALVVSLVALLATIGQLLQQYFATADGYRRCQASVMGHWSQRTRLKWRWRQFRFETLYTTPEIFISGVNISRDGEVLVLGDTTSRKLSLVPPAKIWEESMETPNTRLRTSSSQIKAGDDLKPQYRKGLFHSGKDDAMFSPDPLHNHNDELVSWLPLLHWLHKTTRASFESLEMPRPDVPGDMTPEKLLLWRRYPALLMRERSWDFQPPDVIRPLAKTTVSTIAILARRMGMRWKDFRPEEGIMRAEGHSHIITSTEVRGLGLVLQAHGGLPSQDRCTKNERKSTSPSLELIALELVSYGDSAVSKIPDYTIDTQQEIVASLRDLDPTETCSSILKIILKQDPEFKFPVADLVALTSHYIVQDGSPLVQIPAPSDNINGITRGPLGRKIFTQALDVYVREKNGPTLESEKVDWSQTQVGRQTCWVLWQLKDLKARFPGICDAVEEYDDAWIVRRPLEYLAVLWEIHEEGAVRLLRQLDEAAMSYNGLLQAHFVAAVFSRDIYESSSDLPESEIAKLILGSEGRIIGHYFSTIPKIVKMLRDGASNGLDEKLIVDLWMTMMLRGFCWGAAHFMVPGERVPVAYFGSQLPIYIS